MSLRFPRKPIAAICCFIFNVQTRKLVSFFPPFLWCMAFNIPKISWIAIWLRPWSCSPFNCCCWRASKVEKAVRFFPGNRLNSSLKLVTTNTEGKSKKSVVFKLDNNKLCAESYELQRAFDHVVACSCGIKLELKRPLRPLDSSKYVTS